LTIFNEITVVIISYKSRYQLLNCLSSLKKFKYIFIFDNSNDLKLKKEILIKFPKVRVFVSKKNIGYGAANNFLLKKVNTSYSLLLNPDSRITYDSVNEIYRLANNIKNKFMIITPRNKNYEIRDYFETNKKIIDLKNYEPLINIDKVHFYAPFINMRKIKKYNIYFDENFFLYYEDLDFCKQVKNINQKIYLAHHIHAKHYFGKSSNSKNYDMIRQFHWGWSTTYFYKKNYNSLFSIVITLFFILKTIIKFLNQIIHGKKNSNMFLARAKGLISGLFKNKDYQREKY